MNINEQVSNMIGNKYRGTNNISMLFRIQFNYLDNKKILKTSFHSSKMRTAHALTVSPSMLCAGGCVSAPGGRGVSSWGVSAPKGVSALGEDVC